MLWDSIDNNYSPSPKSCPQGAALEVLIHLPHTCSNRHLKTDRPTLFQCKSEFWLCWWKWGLWKSEDRQVFSCGLSAETSSWQLFNWESHFGVSAVLVWLEYLPWFDMLASPVSVAVLRGSHLITVRKPLWLSTGMCFSIWRHILYMLPDCVDRKGSSEQAQSSIVLYLKSGCRQWLGQNGKRHFRCTTPPWPWLAMEHLKSYRYCSA